MLSDRPYRNALDLETVRRELVLYSGSQFDKDVVRAIIDTDVLERHQAEVKVAERRSDCALPGRPLDAESAENMGVVQG
jgi:HD-GYP domain-containing protein (c-di-GMP phosphodiesterase class II)